MPFAETAQLIAKFDLEGNYKASLGDARKGLQGLGGDLKTLGQRLESPNVRGFLQGTGLSALAGFGAGQGALLAGQAVREVIDYMGQAIDSASDLVESQSKVDAVFKDSAPSIRRWAAELDSAYGLTERQALESAGTLGNFTQALGLTSEEASDLSRTIVELSGDLSSFNNIPATDVLVALQAGLAGETEPARRLGIDISDLRIKTMLAKEGVEAINGEYTQGQKVLARYRAIMQDTSTAQGDAARTSETLAGKQRQLNANTGNLEASLGGFLIGPATDFTGWLVEGTELAQRLVDVLPDIGRELEGLQRDIQEAIPADLDNHFANFVRVAGSGGFLAFTDKFSELGDDSTAVGGAFADLVGEGTAVGDMYDDLAGKGTVVGDVFGSLGDAVFGTGEALDSYAGDVERASNAMATLPLEETAEGLGEVAEGAEAGGKGFTSAFQSVRDLTEGIVNNTTALTDNIREMNRERKALQAFRDDAADIAETRDLGSINKELREHRALRRKAAEEGRVGAFARQQAILEELKGERALRREGVRSLAAFNKRKEGIDGNQTATQRFNTTLAKQRPIVRQLAEQYSVTTDRVVKMLERQGGKVKAVRTRLEELNELRVKPSVDVDTEQANAELDALRSKLIAIQGGATFARTGSGGTGGGRHTTKVASGGPMLAGHLYTVNERREEMFIPGRDGYMHPDASRMAGDARGDVNVYVTPTLTVAAVQVEQGTTRAVRLKRYRAKT